MTSRLMALGRKVAPAGGPAPLFSDTFTGANGADWDTAKWETEAIKGTSTGSSTIQSNQGQMVAAPNSYPWIRRVSKMASAGNIDITGTLTFSAAKEQYPAVGVRGSGALTGDGGAMWENGYAFVFQDTGSGILTARIDRFIAGARTTLVGNSTSINVGTTPEVNFRIQAAGPALRFKLWTGASEPGAWSGETSDANHTSGGLLLNLYGGSSSDATVAWDGLVVVEWTPTMIAGLEQWVRADSLLLSDTASVATWADESGNGFDFTQATAGNQPMYRTNIANGLPVVRSDGVNDRMVSAVPMTNTDDFTLFTAGTLTNTSTYRAVYAIGNNASDGYAIMGRTNVDAHAFLCGGLAWHQSNAPHSFTPAVQILRRSGSTWKLYLNGGSPLVTVVGSAPNTPTTQATLFSHDNTDGNSAGADLVECGCYSAALSDAEVNALGGYLANRLGTTWTAIS